MAGHRYWSVWGWNTASFQFQMLCQELAMHATISGPNICTGGTPICGNADPSHPASYAFDSNTGTYWLSAAGVGDGAGNGPSSVPNWIGYDFGASNPVTVVEIIYTAQQESFGAYLPPTDLYLRYSDDGANWLTYQNTLTTATWTGSLQAQTFAFTASSRASAPYPGDGYTGTLNPSDLAASPNTPTLSGGNLHLAAPSALSSVNSSWSRTTLSHSGDKYYIEARFIANNTYLYDPVSVHYGHDGIGIANGSTTPWGTAGHTGSFSDILLLDFSTGQVADSGQVFHALTATIPANFGSNIGVAIDLTNNQIWFTVDGSAWNGSATANPATNTGGFAIFTNVTSGAAVYLMASLSGASANSMSVNLGATPFQMPVPAGFIPGWGPPPPPVLSVTSYTLSSIGLSWTETGLATSYTVQYRVHPSGGWTQITGLTGTTYTVTGLSAGITYDFEVAALYNTNESAFSNEVTATTGPGVPIDLALGGFGPTFMTATWEPGVGVTPTSYVLQYRVSPSGPWVQITGIPGITQQILNLIPSVAYDVEVAAVAGPLESAFCTPVTGSTIQYVYNLLSCDNAWTVTQPVTQLYGYDHLIGMNVIGLADGIPIGPITVAADGSVTIPFAASNIKIGLPFTPQLQTPYIDVGNPTVQGRRKDLIAATIRVDSSNGIMIGANQPDGAIQQPIAIAPPWSVTPDPIQSPVTYLTPAGQTVTKLFTGDVRTDVLADWDTRGQIAVQGTPGLPIQVTAIIPEVLEGDVIETGYSPEPQQKHSGPGNWMLK